MFYIQMTFIFVYFCCSVPHPDIVGDRRYLLDVGLSETGQLFCEWSWGNPRSFSVVTHNSWCPVEFGQVPICGGEDIDLITYFCFDIYFFRVEFELVPYL